MGNYRNDKRGGSRDRNTSMHKAKCSDCGNSCEVPFKPTSGKPVFCSDCFSSQRSDRGDRDSGRSYDRKPRHFDRGDKQMHKATCDECGNKCEVPFKPTGSKPIFCSDCFSGQDHGGKSGGSSKQFDEINEKLDRILRAIGAPAKKEKKEKTVKTVDLHLDLEDLGEPEKESKPKKKKAAAKKEKKAAKKAEKKEAKKTATKTKAKAKAKTKKKAAPKKTKAKTKKPRK